MSYARYTMGTTKGKLKNKTENLFDLFAEHDKIFTMLIYKHFSWHNLLLNSFLKTCW